MDLIQERINKKTEWINKIYKLALTETSIDFLEIIDLRSENLIIDSNYNSYANAYKYIYRKVKFMDNEIKNFHCFTEDYEELRFKLITIYKSVRNVLEKEYDISQICVDDKTDDWMFIS